ncbi:single-stranded-DNA-specific exonuclease RecJ [Patescibacteria group bacterium]
MTRWNVLSEYKGKQTLIEDILEAREIENISEFISPPSIPEYFSRFPIEFKRSLKLAKEIIESEIESDNHIVIFGDYDSDGINATAILYKYLKFEKKYPDVSYFIPNRFEHSYGVSKLAIDEIIGEYGNKNLLFITVDTGVTAVEEIQYIKDLGHKVIITDHHQKPDELPNMDCLVWSDEVCGAVIAYLLSKILGSKDPKAISLAALATVTDMQSIAGLNRVIVKRGLEVFNRNPPLGIKKLVEVAGKGGSILSTYDLGWMIGPRLNASGRLESADDSLKLLIEKDPATLESISFKLNKINIERQDKTIEMYEKAADFDESDLPKILFSSSEEYHEGVIGLVASKLAQKYYRPSVVISLSDGVGKGSVRSIPGINIIEMLRKHEALFVDLGGHPMAAGFTIEKENIENLEKEMLLDAKDGIDDKLFIPSLDIDMRIPANIIDLELLEDIERLEPFGLGNSRPVFLSEGLKITGLDVVGRDMSHLRLSLSDGDKYYKAIFFGGAESVDDVSFGDNVDLVYTLKKNEYNGNTYIDLVVKDLRKA